MTSRRSPFLHLSCVLSTWAALTLVPSACDAQAGQASRDAAGSSSVATLKDAPLRESQVELLDVAFRASSAMPMMPHVKNRSRAQEAVVETCLDLDQAARARGYSEKIDNWRRGAAYADLAFHCARANQVDAAHAFLESARQVVEAERNKVVKEDEVQIESGQEWRLERILAKIARTYVWVGEGHRAAQLEAGLLAPERGAVLAARAMRADGASFEAQLAALDALAKTQNLDQVRAALDTCVELYDRFYDDEAR